MRRKPNGSWRFLRWRLQRVLLGIPIPIRKTRSAGAGNDQWGRWELWLPCIYAATVRIPLKRRGVETAVKRVNQRLCDRQHLPVFTSNATFDTVEVAPTQGEGFPPSPEASAWQGKARLALHQCGSHRKSRGQHGTRSGADPSLLAFLHPVRLLPSSVAPLCR